MRPHDHPVRQDLLTGQPASFPHLTALLGPSMLYSRDTSQGHGGPQASEGLPQGASSPSWSMASTYHHVLSDMAAVLPGLLGYVQVDLQVRGTSEKKQGLMGVCYQGPIQHSNLRASSTSSMAPLFLRVPHAPLRSLHGFLLSSPPLSFHREHTPQHTRPPIPPFSLQLPVHLHMNLSLGLQGLC